MDAFVGEVRLFPYGYCPHGWLWCEGQIEHVASFQALAVLIGNTYGGDGKTTFGLPDLRGRAVVGATLSNGSPPGLTPYPMNTNIGQVMVAAPLASHTHRAVGGTGMLPGPTATANSVISATAANMDYAPSPMANQTTMAPQTLGSAVPALGPASAAIPHSNIQPYLTLRFAINYDGVFPSFNS